METKLADPGSTLEPRPLGELSAAPLVSVLLANYNYANFIGQSIDSVLSQSYQNWELVVCDDGSTDDSLSVISRYAAGDPRIQSVCQPNGGHTSALNTAFALCRGEIVCFLDSDDLFLPDKLERVVGAFVSDHSAGTVVHRVIRVDEHRNKQGVWPLSTLPSGWFGPELLTNGGVFPYAPPTSGIALRREVANAIFPISTKPPLNMCPDQVVVRIAPLLTAIRRMPDALAEYRVHSSNTYSQRGVTADSVKRQLAISRALWQAQYDFLYSANPAIAAQLAGLEASSLTAMHEYMDAKLSNSPNVQLFHRRFLEVAERRGDEKLLPFWRMSIRLPNFLFQPAVSFLLGQGVVKQFITRFKKLA